MAPQTLLTRTDDSPGPSPEPTPIRPVLHTVKSAQQHYGLSRTRLFEIMDKLDARKLGSRTMITDASLQAFMNSLPKRAA